ncbi:MAG: hypothetical protein H6974_12745 [Gammaproteobacteria bacterium]|nr:hypothetical protein [Gammaproteobacteria bacterium]
MACTLKSPALAPGGRYAQLVESFRNAEGKVRQRTLATLGRLDRMDSEFLVLSG